jgi:hypothetical protein
MKNLSLHNLIHGNNILAKQNYLWLVGRMGPAMMYSSSRSSLRSIAMHDCLWHIEPIELTRKRLKNLTKKRMIINCSHIFFIIML